MTPITELKQILNKELESNDPDFNHTEALNELKLADQATSLGEQFNSLLKVVNRCQDPTEKEIRKGLIKHEQVLKLIKTINRPADKNLQEVYDLAVTEFQNQK
jgi:hypothetical protein